jgi:peptidoglycan lytic transglycosylase
MVARATVCLFFLVVTAVPAIPEEAVSAIEEEGVASTYGKDGGNRVGCGGELDEGALAAAHKNLPCGTRLRVMNKINGKSVVVTINDRGPFVPGRIIDLTPAAARAIGMSGLARVSLHRD